MDWMEGTIIFVELGPVPPQKEENSEQEQNPTKLRRRGHHHRAQANTSFADSNFAVIEM